MTSFNLEITLFFVHGRSTQALDIPSLGANQGRTYSCGRLSTEPALGKKLDFGCRPNVKM